jgi:CRISPR-associated endoribonuclease Cas6
LELFQQQDADLAARLHTDNERRPLTVTPPLQHDGRLLSQVSTDQTYRLRLSSVSHELDAACLHLGRTLPDELAFGGVPWRVERVTSDGSERWTGQASYPELIAAGSEASARNERRWALQFGSPVWFRRAGLNMPLPLPELVFGSLLDRWNAFAPLQLPELREELPRLVAVSDVTLRSENMPVKSNVPQIAALGQCSYVLTEHNIELATILATLARFAAYSGVGAGTMRGYGMTRLLTKYTN